MTATKMTTREKTTLALPEADRFNVGDAATHFVYTDGHAGHVVKVSKNGRTVWVQMANQRILNGPNSGEADALVTTPGGFAGHTEGTQRWEVTANPDGAIVKFTARPVQRRDFARDAQGMTQRDANGRMVEVLVTEWRWKLAGHPTTCQGNSLARGARPHYDYNF